MAFNLVEAFTAGTDDDSGFCQPCKFGHLVKDHAVYCHNDAWADSPRKCWRSWYTGGETKDEDCPGFQPNPAFTGELHPSPVQPPLCSRCGGNKIIPADRNTTETCPR